MDADKQEFLNEFGDDYGYPNGPKTIDEIRATEFTRLKELVYLDHAGATLYSELQMEAVFKDLASNVYGNPHSQSETSSATSEIIREAREQVLQYFNASPKDYKCIFTSGATGALKLVGETFPWSSSNKFIYTMENHNSVLGIREYALDRGATTLAVDIEEDVHHGQSNGTAKPIRLSERQYQRRSISGIHNDESMGLRFNLELVNMIKEDPESVLKDSNCGQWLVLIDAAKGSSTEPPDLSKYPADFVTISFYKLFGYPTGLGALIVRNDAAKLLRKTYFSGGTVAASIADLDFVKKRKGVEEQFEDGTASFLSIASVHHGFRTLNSLSVSAISRHTASLALYVRKILLDLKHPNGVSVCKLYGTNSSMVSHEMGPTISFNMKRPDGSWIGYREVEKLASLSGIQLRTGCFCNPGACAKFLDLSHLDILSNTEAGHVCWDDHDIILGKPTGAVRVSFGYMSTYEDAKKFVGFLKSSFVSLQSRYQNQWKGYHMGYQTARCYLKSITVYPIKSCAGFSVKSWPLSRNGLKHDREWILTSLSGEILTQKKVPEMYFIKIFIDLKDGLMFVESPRCRVSLQIKINLDIYGGVLEDFEMHGQRYIVHGYEEEVDKWFSTAVGRACTLRRCLGLSGDFGLSFSGKVLACRDLQSILSFTNEAQFLLVSEESINDLNTRLHSESQKGVCGAEVDAMRFRPNLVICGGSPYDEDTWKKVKIGHISFASLGGCNRCQMINLVNDDGVIQRFKEPLATLASYRRVKGKILFGILLRYEVQNQIEESGTWLEVGDVYPDPR